MGSALCRLFKDPDDARNVIVPPNLSGFTRVILSLPPSLSIDHVLTELVENDFLNGIEEHTKLEDDHYILKCNNESECHNMITFINTKFGFIAHKGYVKPSRNIVLDNEIGLLSPELAKSTHVALVQSPDAHNPNEQFVAYRREHDPDTEFPKFERVDIEKTIHYQRPGEVGKLPDMETGHERDALKAMRKGEQFDVTDTHVVHDREAVQVDYVEKIRKLRQTMERSERRHFKKAGTQKRIREQFKYDHMNQLIELKRKKYGVQRAKRIYEEQRRERLEIAGMKQKYHPYKPPDSFMRQQTKFWQKFDYSTK